MKMHMYVMNKRLALALSNPKEIKNEKIFDEIIRKTRPNQINKKEIINYLNGTGKYPFKIDQLEIVDTDNN